MSVDLYPGRVIAPARGQPLVFAFHGTGGDEHQFFGLARSLLPEAGVVSPRGDVRENGAARFFRRTGEGVYDMDDLARATARLTAYVQAHRAAHPDSPAYGFGYSNGANILASAVMAQPDLFDRVGLMHPLIPWSPDPAPDLAGKPVLITAGERDPICPRPRTQALIDWFTGQGAQVVSRFHPGGHELRPSEVTALQTLLTGA